MVQQGNNHENHQEDQHGKDQEDQKQKKELDQQQKNQMDQEEDQKGEKIGGQQAKGGGPAEVGRPVGGPAAVSSTDLHSPSFIEVTMKS